MPGSKKLLKSISSARNSNICSKCKAIFREAEEQSNIWLPVSPESPFWRPRVSNLRLSNEERWSKQPNTPQH